MQLNYTDFYMVKLFEESFVDAELAQIIESSSLDELKSIIAGGDPEFQRELLKEQYQTLSEASKVSPEFVNHLKEIKKELEEQNKKIDQAMKLSTSGPAEKKKLEEAKEKIAAILKEINDVTKTTPMGVIVKILKIVITIIRYAIFIAGILSIIAGIAAPLIVGSIAAVFPPLAFAAAIGTPVLMVGGAVGGTLLILASKLIKWVSAAIFKAVDVGASAIKDGKSTEELISIVKHGKELIAKTSHEVKAVMAKAEAHK